MRDTRVRGRLAAIVGGATFVLAGAAHGYDWEASAAAGTDRWFHPGSGGQSFVLFDLRGRGSAGDFHLYFNTETLQVGVERVPLGSPRVELSAGVRAEALLAGVLRYYIQEGTRRPERGFFASYALAFATVKWLPGGPHSLELAATGRRWFFGREEGVTGAGFALPPDTWVFEPRVRYTLWRITSPGDEWRGDILFPRVVGFAAGLELGADVRSDARAWGAADGRNRPGAVIAMARQWLRAGAQLHPSLRLQVEQSASWGSGEDDLTRVRVGGMSPYVVPVPGVPWPGLLSERLVAAQASLHWRPSRRLAHELGVAVGGGLFNDVRRVGALDEFGALGGAALFTDLRFGALTFHARAGYGFPAPWLPSPPHLSALATVGYRLF